MILLVILPVKCEIVTVINKINSTCLNFDANEHWKKGSILLFAVTILPLMENITNIKSLNHRRGIYTKKI